LKIGTTRDVLCLRAFGAVVFVLIFASCIFAEGENEEGLGSQQERIQSEQEGFLDLGWAWGDVISLDLENAEATIRYLDYESGAEKVICLSVDGETTFENVEDLDQIKIGDSISVDYIVTTDAINIARLITVEKVEVGIEEIVPGG
jgi:hypothetical protein